MDLIMSIVLVVVISSFKVATVPKSEMIEVVTVSETGVVTEAIVQESELEIGNNLMLRREPRAYHKIVDEMGLS